jgi:hypothetical protein
VAAELLVCDQAVEHAQCTIRRDYVKLVAGLDLLSSARLPRSSCGAVPVDGALVVGCLATGSRRGRLRTWLFVRRGAVVIGSAIHE